MWKRTLLVAAIVLAAAGLYASSLSTKNAKSQADAIVAADNAGQDTTAAIASLKQYIGSHTGVAVGFTLTAGYQRAQAQAKAAADATAANAQVYAAAQAACSGKTDSITQAHCNQQYIAAHLQALPPAGPIASPKSADYQYDLRSPLWAPDLAGALWAGAVAAFVLGLIGFMSRRRKRR